jgi:hypothetical protein
MKRKPKRELVLGGRFEVWEHDIGGVCCWPAGDLLRKVQELEEDHMWRPFAEVAGWITRAALIPGGLTERFREEWSRQLYDALLRYPERVADVMKKSAVYLKDPTEPPAPGRGSTLFLERRTDTEPARPFALTVVEAARFAVSMKWSDRKKNDPAPLTVTKREIRHAWDRQKWFTPSAVVHARKGTGGEVKPYTVSESEWVKVWKKLGLDDLEQGRGRMHS